MLILRTSNASPFGRKIRISAAVLGLSNQITVQNADTVDANDSLRQQNPLGKIPTLILENGEALFDSRVIAEYLNELDAEQRLIPTHRRIEVLKLQALGDGLLDAALLQVYEARFRPAEHHVSTWLDHQRGKVDRALAYAEARLTPAPVSTPNIGEITLACALGYLDFRFGESWRASHPQLSAWIAAFADAQPAYNATRPDA